MKVNKAKATLDIRLTGISHDQCTAQSVEKSILRRSVVNALFGFCLFLPKNNSSSIGLSPVTLNTLMVVFT